MSFRRSPYLRIQIKDLYNATINFDGTGYTLIDSSGLTFEYIIVCGTVTEKKEISNNDGRFIYQLLLDDQTGAIWVNTTDKETTSHINLWDNAEVIGSLEFLPDKTSTSIELNIRPINIQTIIDPYKYVLHTLDARIQKKLYPELIRKLDSFQKATERFLKEVAVEKEVEVGTTNGFKEESSIEDTESLQLDSINYEDPLFQDKETSSQTATGLEEYIIKVLSSEDHGEGVSFERIKQLLIQSKGIDEVELEDTIFNMQMEGTIFEPTWRVYRLSE
jgi:RPA family protein